MGSLCRHFDSNFKYKDLPVGSDRGGEAVSNPAGRGEENDETMAAWWHANTDAPVSYRALLAWIDPIDVGRVAKRCVGVSCHCTDDKTDSTPATGPGLLDFTDKIVARHV